MSSSDDNEASGMLTGLDGTANAGAVLQQKSTTVHVAGDAYWAVFHLPAGECSHPSLTSGHSYAIALPVGRDYIYRAICAVCGEDPDNTTRITLGPGNWTQEGELPTALYDVRAVNSKEEKTEKGTPHPVLRLRNAETQKLTMQGLSLSTVPEGVQPPAGIDVLVHWCGELIKRTLPDSEPPACRIHVQAGLAFPIDQVMSTALAKPSVARIAVVNVGELAGAYRIRRTLSYEAIAVDLLRHLRGTNSQAVLQPLFQNLFPNTPAAPLSVLAVRLNNSAVFLYMVEAKGPDASEFAWLLCHKQECAPLSEPELGPMVGYTGFVSAHIAAAAEDYLKTCQAEDYGQLRERLVVAVQRSLGWQRVSYEHGLFSMLIPPLINRDASSALNYATLSKHYDAMFKEIEATLEGLNVEDTSGVLSRFDDHFREKVLSTPVEINRAVAHRTQWFMARALLKEDQREEPEEAFRQIALDWLTNSVPPTNKVPVVKIGMAELTDRREVEDYLTIQQALRVYALSRLSKPLSIAVFGSPGSGKSFAVEQVVKHLSARPDLHFKKTALRFNLGQFKTLDDLPAALHLVRNECLSHEIPIVFFDEFDSSFNGQTFGWLKYFLAPMQDGEFYHAGQTFKLGHAVFVFAGGVNRSFEELNGRLRNPGFCEAKGPDFISRLKAHLNVQGINKSESEADQGRYILRRGILLRYLAREQLKLKDKDASVMLFHRDVANAFLKIDRFKHGVRSLEAIVRMCDTRPGHPIGPSELPSLDQLEIHVDAMKLLGLINRTPVQL